MRDCTFAREVWKHLVPSTHFDQFVQGNFYDWLKDNLWKRDRFGYQQWGIIFGVGVWLIWKDRNEVVFRNSVQNSRGLASGILGFANSISACMCMHGAIGGVCKEWKLTGWERPPKNWISINTDGSVCGPQFKASTGGVLREECGKWLVGYGRNIGSFSVAKAELWEIWDGFMYSLGTWF